MKKLDLSSCVAGNQFAGTAGTLNFLQGAYTELGAVGIIAQIGSTYSAAIPYVLYGCVATVSSPNTTITAGAIFYNGEVFIIPAQTFTTAGGSNVILCTISKTNNFTQPDGTLCDPSTFTITPAASVHNIWSITYSTGTTGTGTFDFTAAIPYKGYSSSGIVWSAVSAGTWTDTGGSIFNTAYKLIDNNTVFLCGGATSSAVLGGGSPIMTLPAIVRPAKNVFMLCSTSAGGITTGLGVLNIQPSGLAILSNTTTSANGVVNFDGVNYRTN